MTFKISSGSGRILFGLLSALLLILAGCNEPDSIFDLNCNPNGGINTSPNPPRLPMLGRDYVQGIFYTEIDVNPNNSNEILSGKYLWDKNDPTNTEPSESGLVVIDLVTGEEKWILKESKLHSFKWGKAGWIVGENSQEGQLYLIKPNGDSLHRMTQQDGRYHHPSWSHDGKLLIATGTNSEGDSRLVVIDLEGNILKERLDSTRVFYTHSGDWNDENLIVASNVGATNNIPEARHALTFMSSPNMIWEKSIIVLPEESNSSVLHQNWANDNRDIIWLGSIFLYKTNFLTEETELIFGDCDIKIRHFEVMEDGKKILLAISELTHREDIDLPEINRHLYVLNVETKELTFVK